MAEKKKVDIKMFWYTDQLVIPKFVTIITTINKDGNINAAPYSLGTPYNVAHKQPQILIGMRKTSHSCKNVLETKEFVVNFPSWDYLNDVMETARFWPLGDNEIDHTRFTLVPSKSIKPPSIKECGQHIECRFYDIIELGQAQSFIVGDIVDIVIDERLLKMGRGERIKALDLPIYLGDERRRYFYYGRMSDIEMMEFKSSDTGHQGEIKTSMPWEETALQELSKTPLLMREKIAETIEEEARTNGLTKVTHAFYKEMEEQYSMKEIQARFD